VCAPALRNQAREWAGQTTTVKASTSSPSGSGTHVLVLGRAPREQPCRQAGRRYAQAHAHACLRACAHARDSAGVCPGGDHAAREHAPDHAIQRNVATRSAWPGGARAPRCPEPHCELVCGKCAGAGGLAHKAAHALACARHMYMYMYTCAYMYTGIYIGMYTNQAVL